MSTTDPNDSRQDDANHKLSGAIPLQAIQPEGSATQSSMTPTPESIRIAEVVTLLKHCKQEGLSYYNATEWIEQKGYTIEEVQQASYQFVYTDPLSTEHEFAILRQPTGQLSEQIEREADIQVAKAKMNSDFWMGTIPIVGGFYRYKRIGDIVNYTSLRTGRSRLVTFGIWLLVDTLAFIGCLFVPFIIFHVGYLKDSPLSGILLPYIVIALAFLLFKLFFRKPKTK